MKKSIIRPFHIAVMVMFFILLFTYEAVSIPNLHYDFSFVGYGGTFKYHDLKVFGIPVYWFMLLCGLGITFYTSIKRHSYFDISKVKAVILPIVYLVISFIGAKILYILENIKTINHIELNGMSMFGALYFTALSMPLLSLIFKIQVWELYDFVTPFGLILLSSVRVGCFINGCCGAWTFWHNGVPIVLPVQLFEVLCDLLILELCYKLSENQKYIGYSFPVSLFLYGVCRFLLEFLRKNPKTVLFLTNAQIFSLIAIVSGIVMIKILKSKTMHKHHKSNKVKKGSLKRKRNN